MDWMLSCIQGYGNEGRHLVLLVTTYLASLMVSSKVGIIYMDISRQKQNIHPARSSRLNHAVEHSRCVVRHGKL